ncbi:unnamed protein product [Tuwongella immobilis]|uniref:Uncharacterized protein n=1 Tax=Tuwongella immobilis TaxID=692036 RepID=A0A6C2YI63_9BACT|nr:unnamed protein product [Tuwongella immobilis]VTR97084.1 unnamed protein product [Tuwongella immobilis]
MVRPTFDVYVGLSSPAGLACLRNIDPGYFLEFAVNCLSPTASSVWGFRQSQTLSTLTKCNQFRMLRGRQHAPTHAFGRDSRNKCISLIR